MSDDLSDPQLDGETDRLLQWAALGDDHARQQLLERHRGRLRGMVAERIDRRLSARVDPSDIVQEALIEAADGLDCYLRQRPLPFYPWLRQITWERLIALHRRHVDAEMRSVTREEATQAASLPEDSAIDLVGRLAVSESSPSRWAERNEVRQLVRQAIAGLSDTDREVLVLRHLEGLQTPEIAVLLGISAEAVRARHVRAVEHLRRQFGRDSLE